MSITWPTDLTQLMKRISTPAEEVFKGLDLLGDYTKELGDTREAALKEYIRVLRHVEAPYHVNPAVGSSGDGKTWATAFKTMTEAIDAVSHGGTIFLTGVLTESIDYSDGAGANAKSNISIIGAEKSYNSPIWIPGASHIASVDCPGWTFQNIRFVVPADPYASIYLTMDEVAHGAYLAKVIDCSFTGGTGAGVRLEGAPNGVQVLGCQFNTITGYGIRNAATGFAAVGACLFADNRFTDCKKQIEMRQVGGCIFLRNYFEGKSSTTRHLYFTHPNAGYTNIMLGNAFGGTYTIAGGYKFNTNDFWAGNWGTDTGAAGINTEGQVIAVPA